MRAKVGHLCVSYGRAGGIRSAMPDRAKVGPALRSKVDLHLVVHAGNCGENLPFFQPSHITNLQILYLTTI